MWLYISLCIALFIGVKNEPNKKYFSAPKESDIFNDVIRNISRVNIVLQGLINNFEEMQNMYKSQENVDSRLSDSGNDEKFERNKEGKPRSNTKRSTAAETFAATPMYWSDREKESKYGDEIDTEEISDHETEGIASIIKNIDVDKTKVISSKSKLAPDSEKLSSESSGSVEEAEETLKDNIKLNSQDLPKIVEANTENPSIKPEKEIIQVFFKSAELVDEMEPIVESIVNTQPKKTRYQKVTNKLPQQMPVKLQSANSSEAYSRNKEIPENKNENFNEEPIDNKAYYENKEAKTSTNNDKVDNDRRHQKKSDMYKIKKDNVHQSKIDRIEENTNNDDTSSNESISTEALRTNVQINKIEENTNDDVTSSNESISTELLKTNALRQEYGDACLKMVVRKCFKACKSSLKSACKEMKCSASLKKKFKSESKKGCIIVFEGNGVLRNSDQDNIAEPFRKSILGPEFKACLPSLGKSPSTRKNLQAKHRNKTNTPNINKSIDFNSIKSANKTQEPKAAAAKVTFNILRDRFERACQKISSDKCKKVCSNARKLTCETVVCHKRLEKYFKVECKANCRRAFTSPRPVQDTSSDSDDTSSTGSDSDSDYDSDFE